MGILERLLEAKWVRNPITGNKHPHINEVGLLFPKYYKMGGRNFRGPDHDCNITRCKVTTAPSRFNLGPIIERLEKGTTTAWST